MPYAVSAETEESTSTVAEDRSIVLIAELTARHVAISLHLLSAESAAAAAHFERAQEIVHQAGARPFEALNLAFIGEAHRQFGDRARAVAAQEEALAIAGETGMSYVGAIVLGYRAVAAYDDAGMRHDSLREGERILAAAIVAHNALFFYTFAIESCLLAEDWSEARRYADCFSAHFAAETPPFVEFQVERGRLLAELSEKGSSATLVEAP